MQFLAAFDHRHQQVKLSLKYRRHGYLQAVRYIANSRISHWLGWSGLNLKFIALNIAFGRRQCDSSTASITPPAIMKVPVECYGQDNDRLFYRPSVDSNHCANVGTIWVVTCIQTAGNRIHSSHSSHYLTHIHSEHVDSFYLTYMFDWSKWFVAAPQRTRLSARVI